VLSVRVPTAYELLVVLESPRQYSGIYRSRGDILETAPTGHPKRGDVSPVTAGAGRHRVMSPAPSRVGADRLRRAPARQGPTLRRAPPCPGRPERRRRAPCNGRSPWTRRARRTESTALRRRLDALQLVGGGCGRPDQSAVRRRHGCLSRHSAQTKSNAAKADPATVL
jgi:hypothetical protein